MVLYFGEVVEIGEAEQVTMDPHHDYTTRLIASVPVPYPKVEMERREERRRLRKAAAKAA